MKVVCTIAIWFDRSDKIITMSGSGNLMEDALQFAFTRDSYAAERNIGIIHSFSGLHVTRDAVAIIIYESIDTRDAIHKLRALDYVNVDVFFNLIGSITTV